MESYLAIISIPALITYIKKNKKGLVLALLFLLFISGLRYEFGVDYASYYSIFNNIKFNNFEEFSHLEKGFIFLNRFLLYMGLDFRFLFFVVTFINLFLFYKTIEYFNIKKTYYWLILFLYLSNYSYFFYHLSMVRQSIAIYIFTFSLKYINEKKFFKYLLLIVIASFFHKSALLLIAIYFLTNYLNEKLMIIMMGVGIIFALNQNITTSILYFILEILNLENYKHYINIIHLNTGLRYAFNIFLAFFIIYILRFEKLHKKERIILKIFYLFCFFKLFVIYIGTTYHRFLCYFDIIKIITFYIFLLILFRKNQKIRNMKKILFFIILFTNTLLFIRSYNSLITTYKNTDYLNFLSKYKCILFHKDIYKNKIFYRDGETGRVYFKN